MTDILKTDNIVLKDQLCVWKTKVSHHIKEVHYYWSMLSDDEKKEADKYLFINDKNRYIISRGILKVLLSLYTKIHPYKINLNYTKYGKPYIPKINFNLAHSRDVIVYGFIKNSPLGIDVEYLNMDISLSDIESIMNFMCSNREKTILYNLFDKQKKDYFYKIWVIKEAFIKFIGLGFSLNLKQFNVYLDENESITISNEVSKNKYSLTTHFFESYKGYYSAFVTKKKVNMVIYANYNNKFLDFI